MTFMQGFGSGRFGLRTRRTFSGGSRIGVLELIVLDVVWCGRAVLLRQGHCARMRSLALRAVAELEMLRLRCDAQALWSTEFCASRVDSAALHEQAPLHREALVGLVLAAAQSTSQIEDSSETARGHDWREAGDVNNGYH